MIRFKQKGNFSKSISFLERAKEVVKLGYLDKFGRAGVEALSLMTPIDTGNTASSWYYKITHIHGSIILSFHNSNIQNGCPIAIILQYGHSTRNGGWVKGIDYINPAIQPIFNQIAEEAWREVTKI